MKSTPCRPASIMRLRALLPPPPTPTTLITAKRPGSVSNSSKAVPPLPHDPDCLPGLPDPDRRGSRAVHFVLFSWSRRAFPSVPLRQVTTGTPLSVASARVIMHLHRRPLGIAHIEVGYLPCLVPPLLPQGGQGGQLGPQQVFAAVQAGGDVVLQPEHQLPRLLHGDAPYPVHAELGHQEGAQD